VTKGPARSRTAQEFPLRRPVLLGLVPLHEGDVGEGTDVDVPPPIQGWCWPGQVWSRMTVAAYVGALHGTHQRERAIKRRKICFNHECGHVRCSAWQGRVSPQGKPESASLTVQIKVDDPFIGTVASRIEQMATCSSKVCVSSHM